MKSITKPLMAKNVVDVHAFVSYRYPTYPVAQPDAGCATGHPVAQRGVPMRNPLILASGCATG